MMNGRDWLLLTVFVALLVVYGLVFPISRLLDLLPVGMGGIAGYFIHKIMSKPERHLEDCRE